MHDVARIAGVSVKTVSNVINHHPHVRTFTRDRVLAAIDQLDYRPNLSARGLRSGRTGIIGLALPALKENYFAELADAVIRAAERRGLGVVVEQTSGDRNSELLAVSGAARPSFLDGLLFSPISLGQSDVDALETPLPIVLLGERIFNGPTDHVAMHNTSAAHAAVKHLLDIGRTRIALIGAGDPDSTEAGSASLRVRGYRQALEHAGLPYDTELVRRASHWNRATGAEAAQGLLDDRVRFDAVFALNDTLGLGALRALGAAGVDMPSDVALIGFDNIDESRYSVPSMSTVDPGRDEIAQTAVDLLIERIGEKETSVPPRTIKPEFRIVRRESTGFVDATD
ncbi:LacI family DNA-binding transcriptional regulator [Marisediminicola sp. LYQ134]|uniref:LacI family DNA-binding transcriptional regulator n=1 Tax=Marisediminicola sp. LYQ134 TaxID=3391061 RepID=UPI003983B95E